MADLTTLNGLLRRLRFTVRSTLSRSDSPHYQAVGGLYEYRGVLGVRTIHVRQAHGRDGRWTVGAYEWAHMSRRGRTGRYRPL